jgi:hypothetical protein
MAGPGDPAGGGLEPGNPAAVRRPADTGRRVTADVKRRPAGGHDRRRPAAAAPRRARQIVGVIGAPVDQVIGLPGQGQLRRVRFAEQDRPRRAQAGHRGGILGGHKAGAPDGLARGDDACRIQRVLDSHGHAVQGPEDLPAREGGIGGMGLHLGGVGAQLHDRVQRWIHGVDALKIGVHHLRRRDVLGANGTCQRRG